MYVNETVSSEESDEVEDVVTSISIIRKRKQCILKQKDDHQQLLAVETIPAEAKVVPITLSQCKKIIKFIKKVNF